MNPLFSLPIHGIACLPFYEKETKGNKQTANIELPHKINLTFKNIAFNAHENPIWVIKDQGARYTTQVQLFENKQSNNHVYYLKIDCQGSGIIEIEKNNITVNWQENGTDFSHYFQTLVAALWLELQSVLCIHANALSINNNAIALIAPSRTGKTTLTTALCKQGLHAMTDDMMALYKNGNKYNIFPSWPVVRMWPDALSYFENENVLNPEQVLSKVHEQFEKKIVALNPNKGLTTQQKVNNKNDINEPKSLKTIYFLNRVEGLTTECEIVDVPNAKAIIYLLQNSILGDAYRALHIENNRLLAFSQLLQKVNCKQINYRSGLQYIDQVAEQIVKQL